MTAPPGAAWITLRGVTATRVLFGLLLCWTFLLACTRQFCTDVWWHLRTGQLILAGKGLPTSDWYTALDAQRPWVDLQWGFQLLAAGLYGVGGATALILLRAAVLTLAVALAASAAGRGLPTWLRVACWLLPALTITGRLVDRPETFSLLFLALWLWILSRVEERPRLLWLLPLVQVLWVNTHSLFPLGLVVGGAYLADRLVRVLVAPRSGIPAAAPASGLLPLAVAGLLSVLASLVNPYGLQGALFPLEVFRKLSTDHAFYSARVLEFLPPIEFIRRQGFWNLSLVALLGTWLTAAASFVVLGARRRFQVMEILLFAAFSFLVWRMSRNMAIFAVIAGFALCSNLAAARLARLRDRPESSARESGRASTIVALLLVALIGLRFTGAWVSIGGKFREFGFGEWEAWYAHDACRFAGRAGFPETAFVSNFGQAAVWIFHNGPERKVFMDGRLEVCSRRTFEQYEAVREAMVRKDRRWMEMVRGADGQLPVVVLDSRTSTGEILGVASLPDWRLVFADRAAAVFLDVATADRLGLPEADPEPLLHAP